MEKKGKENKGKEKKGKEMEKKRKREEKGKERKGKERKRKRKRKRGKEKEKKRKEKKGKGKEKKKKGKEKKMKRKRKGKKGKERTGKEKKKAYNFTTNKPLCCACLNVTQHHINTILNTPAANYTNGYLCSYSFRMFRHFHLNLVMNLVTFHHTTMACGTTKDQTLQSQTTHNILYLPE